MSGFTNANIPDQVNHQHTFSTDWFDDLWSASYGMTHSFQDDQRSGVPDEDVRDTSHNLNFSLLPCALAGVESCEALALDLGGVFTRQKIAIEGLTRRTRTGFSGLSWTFCSDFSFNSNFSYTNEVDSNNDLTRNAYTVGAGLAWQTALPVPTLEPWPLRTFVQWNRQVEHVRDNLFGVRQDVSSWTIILGMSVAVF
jgi:hypothetical protein